MSPENSKPEWFQMADADGIPPQPRSKRVIRVMALATPLFVLGAGLVFAQTQDSPTAVASAVASATPTTTDPIALSNTPSTAPASTPTSTQVVAPASTPASTQVVAPAPAPAIHTIEVSQTSSATQSPAITIKKPAITMPTGGGEDDALERSSDDD